MSHFNESALEHAVIELFESVGIPHCAGTTIHKEISEVLLYDDLKHYLLHQYGADDITLQEIKSITRMLETYSSAALYASNKAILKMLADGFVFKRDDRSKKDLFIQLLDFSAERFHNLQGLVNEAAEPGTRRTLLHRTRRRQMPHAPHQRDPEILRQVVAQAKLAADLPLRQQIARRDRPGGQRLKSHPASFPQKPVSTPVLVDQVQNRFVVQLVVPALRLGTLDPTMDDALGVLRLTVRPNQPHLD